MAIWLVRAGRHGEHEALFLDENRVYLTWSRFNRDLDKVASLDDMYAMVREFYPGASAGKVGTHGRQIWAFTHRIKKGDWVVTPSKFKPSVNFGEVLSDYRYDPKAQDPYYHYRDVKWFARDVPRSVFDQDILYTLGALLTVCQVKRNDAEARLKRLAQSDWVRVSGSGTTAAAEDEDEAEAQAAADLAYIARNQIAKLIIERFKGQALERLVEAILKAQGYTTYRSPKGPDKGIDILAAPGSLGFGKPRICVQVKSQESPIDTQTLNQLIGSMQNVQADQGLLVAWGGFKSSVDKEVPVQFFRVRLWDQDDLIDKLLENYDKLDDDIRADLPLKRMWTVAQTEEEE